MLSWFSLFGGVHTLAGPVKSPLIAWVHALLAFTSSQTF